MTLTELRASRALHVRRKTSAQRKLATTRKAAHAGRDVVTDREASQIHALERRVRDEAALIARRDRQIAAKTHAAQGGVHRGTIWLPHVKRVTGRDAGPFVSGAGPKIVWHTTEGGSIDGAISAYRATGSWPTLTFDPRTGQIVQHLQLNRSARALEHPAGVVETNRAHATQVELVGAAAETPHWSDEAYQRIAHLARMLERATGTPRVALAGFSTTPHRLSSSAWFHGAGHCGHQHVPGNHHWDPGAFRIDKIV